MWTWYSKKKKHRAYRTRNDFTLQIIAPFLNEGKRNAGWWENNQLEKLKTV